MRLGHPSHGDTPGVRLLFTDILMPGARDGLELVQEIHAHWANVLLLITPCEAKLTHADVRTADGSLPNPTSRTSLLELFAGLIAGKPIDPR